MEIQNRIDQLDWSGIADNMDECGFACAPKVLADTECNELILEYNNEPLYRKTINMERYRFGLGEYKYYQYPLPAIVQQLRECVYPKLAPIANNWMRVLNIDHDFPLNLAEL